MARSRTVVSTPSPVRVGLAGVELPDGGPSIRPLPMPSLGGWLVAYDRRRWTEDQAAEIMWLILDSDIEVITAAPEALR